MSRVAIVEPGSSGLWLLDRAAALGYEPVVLTAAAGGRQVPEAHLAHARHVEVVDTNDDDAVVSAVERLHGEEPISAVVPGLEYYVPLAARLGDSLSVPGLGLSTALVMRHKHQMRAAVAAAGIDQPRFALVRTAEELAGALAEVGLPAVVKPVDQAGSMNVRKVSTQAEAADALAQALASWHPDLKIGSMPAALVEEYVVGPEYSVEGYVENGQVQVLAVTRKLLGPEPYFVEAGHVLPGDLSPQRTAELGRYVSRVVAALGQTMGVFHAEARLTERGPLVIEVGARLAGDRIPRLLYLALGVDMADVMLRCHLGVPNEPAPADPPAGPHAGVRYFLRPGLASYRQVVVDPELREDPRIQEHVVLIPPGVPVPPLDSYLGRLGYAIVTGSSYAEVLDLLDRVDRGTTFLG
jgi:biotin carboxylase